MPRRPCRHASNGIVPDPLNGSRIVCPGRVNNPTKTAAKPGFILLGYEHAE